MARLLRPVTKIISVMPAAAASSTAYWMSGLSTIGSISLGLALVTGRKRLPRPATGKTAFLSLACMESEIVQHFEEFFFPQHFHSQRPRAIELGARIVARHDEIRFLGHRAGHFVPFRLDRGARLFARHARKRPGQDEALHRSRNLGRGRRFLPTNPALYQIVNNLPVVRLLEELPDRARDHRPDVHDLQQLLLGGSHERLEIAKVTREIARR